MSNDIMFLALIIVFLIAVIFCISIARERRADEKKDLKQKATGKDICIHTKLDCENCSMSSKCVQKEGKGLLWTKKEE